MIHPLLISHKDSHAMHATPSIQSNASIHAAWELETPLKLKIIFFCGILDEVTFLQKII